MTESTVSSPADAYVAAAGQPGEPQLVSRPVVAVSLLTTHPGNVRTDLDLDPAFVASIREVGLLVPLRIAPNGDGTYRVIDGHRRLAAGIQAGLTEIPYDLAGDRETDEAGQYLDMFGANHHRRDLTVLQEADALFAASEAGASRTRIKKATGLRKEEVGTALAAARLSAETRGKTGCFHGLDLEQYALLAEFQDDADALDRLLHAFGMNQSGQHTAEQIRRERSAEAERQQILCRFRDDEYQITEQLPAGAMPLHFLLHDGQDLTPETHANCPGRGIIFYSWDPASPMHYCTDPAGNGHESRNAVPSDVPVADGQGDADSSATSWTRPAPQSGAEPSPDAGRRLVVEGNRAWTAAATVRRRWLGSLFCRRAAPKETAAFVAGQLLTMPGPLRNALTKAPHLVVFSELIGHVQPAQLESWPAARLPLVPLAVIVTAYEDQMGGEGGKATWRPDRYSPCHRDEAGTYLRFLANLGYELSLIEQAVSDGTPYSGDQPGEDLASAAAETGGHAGQDDPTALVADPATARDAEQTDANHADELDGEAAA
jgi:ParB family chromosome partitioning protein